MAIEADYNLDTSALLVVDGQTALASDVNDVTTAVNSKFQLVHADMVETYNLIGSESVEAAASAAASAVSAGEASDSAVAASASASSASGFSVSASGYSTSASEYSVSASEYADEAAASYSSALISASNASDFASAASVSAGEASDSADAAAQSAIDAAAAADINIDAATIDKHGALLYQNSTDDGFNRLNTQGTSGQALISSGPDAAPYFGTPASAVKLATAVNIGGTSFDGTVSITPAFATTINTSSSTTEAGKVRCTTAAEVNGGTEQALAVTPDALSASYAGTKAVSIQVEDGTTSLEVGTGKAYFSIPSSLNGMNLVSVHAEVVTAGVTGVSTFDVNKNGTSMLSTKITIDSSETGSDTAVTVPAINTSVDHVATYDVISVDIDGISTTAPEGLIVTLEFRLP